MVGGRMWGLVVGCLIDTGATVNLLSMAWWRAWGRGVGDGVGGWNRVAVYSVDQCTYKGGWPSRIPWEDGGGLLHLK